MCVCFFFTAFVTIVVVVIIIIKSGMMMAGAHAGQGYAPFSATSRLSPGAVRRPRK